MNSRKQALYDQCTDAYQAARVAYQKLVRHWSTHFFGACIFCREGRTLEEAHKDACDAHRAIVERYKMEPWA